MAVSDAIERTRRRSLERLNLAVFLAGVATLGVVVACLAAHPSLRWRFDATKTRAYSLSPQTRQLLAGLDGDWTIAVVLSPDQVDRALHRQVDEILDRYDESPRVSIVRIDPGDPDALDRYDALLADLRAISGERLDEYDRALAAGREALAELTVFLQQQSGRLAAVREQTTTAQLDQLVAILGLRLEQAGRVEDEVERALQVDEGRPLPDYETARSVLAAALTAWGEELFQVGQVLRRWRDDETADIVLRQYASSDHGVYEDAAQRLAVAADPLKHLPPLELARIGRALEAGETAIVIGPPGAAVIPPAQLFPNVSLRQRDTGEVTYDRRFRGEQAISATIRSLESGPMPSVVVVHAQDESLLSPRSQSVDFAGAAGVLRASRVEVREWLVGRSDRPRVEPGRPVVWVVIPPPIPTRRTLAVTEPEQKLLDVTRELLADGEPVLLSLPPSALAKAGKRDPWPDLVAPLGIVAETTHVVYERVLDQQGEAVNQRVLQLTSLEPGHPVAAAAHGLQVSLDLPLPVRPVAGDVTAGLSVIAAARPSASRWLEEDWMIDPARLDTPAESQRFEEAVPLAVAAERLGPAGEGVQRVIVVGSGGWLLSYQADAAVSVGGDRMMLLNPGNYELLLASIAWLAGADDMIATSPVSRQVARLDGVTAGARALWRVIALAGLPGACLALGLGVWAVRRR